MHTFQSWGSVIEWAWLTSDRRSVTHSSCLRSVAPNPHTGSTVCPTDSPIHMPPQLACTHCTNKQTSKQTSQSKAVLALPLFKVRVEQKASKWRSVTWRTTRSTPLSAEGTTEWTIIIINIWYNMQAKGWGSLLPAMKHYLAHWYTTHSHAHTIHTIHTWMRPYKWRYNSLCISYQYPRLNRQPYAAWLRLWLLMI